MSPVSFPASVSAPTPAGPVPLRDTARGNTSLRPPTPDPAEQARLRDLQETDRKVRAHEAAHLAAAGGLAQGGASFTLTRGSDGRYYATGGEVSISTSEGRDAQETLARAQQIRAAALAPADPSAQDYRVAAQAARMESTARQELAAQQVEAVQGGVPQASAALGLAAELTAAYGEAIGRGSLLDLFA